MLEVHAILQRQRCNENITKKTGTLSDAYDVLLDGTERTIQSPTDEDRQSACYSGKKTHSIKNNLLCIGNLRIVWLSSTYEGH